MDKIEILKAAKNALKNFAGLKRDHDQKQPRCFIYETIDKVSPLPEKLPSYLLYIPERDASWFVSQIINFFYGTDAVQNLLYSPLISDDDVDFVFDRAIALAEFTWPGGAFDYFMKIQEEELIFLGEKHREFEKKAERIKKQGVRVSDDVAIAIMHAFGTPQEIALVFGVGRKFVSDVKDRKVKTYLWEQSCQKIENA